MAATSMVLKPTFDPSAEPLVLDGPLTAIGASQPALVRFGDDRLAGVETRHARIICEGDTPLLLDLSESGATLHNGEPAGTVPVPLRPGDVLTFGKHLELRLENVSAAVADATRLLEPVSAAVQLLLTPVDDDGAIAPLAVTEFPMLMSSADGHFAGYREQLPEPMSFLSRRHAHIYRAGDTLLLEDLGSTNGSWHNGELMKDQAVELSSGDEVRFGHRRFSFSVSIQISDAKAPITEQALPDGTVMISSAGSFLDVYCDAAPAQRTKTGDHEPAQGATAAMNAGSLLRALRVRWQRWPYLRARQLGVLVGGPLLVVALIAGVALRDTRPQDIERLLRQQESQAALALASTFAADKPTDDAASQLLASTFERAVLPGWIERMDAEQPASARRYLGDILALAPELETNRTVALLRWMVELAEVSRGQATQVNVSAATDNVELRQLAEHWQANADQYTRLLRRFTDSYDSLATVHTQAMSRIRAIQGDGLDRLNALDELKQQVETQLDAGEFATARRSTERFVETHPQILAMDRFLEDLEGWAEIAASRSTGDLETFLAQTADFDFATTFFRAQAAGLGTERQLAQRRWAQLTEARRLWQQGKLEAAVRSLSVDADSAWTGPIENQRRRFAELQQGFADLLNLVGTEDYADAVIDFYARLDPNEDVFLRDALTDDFSSQRERAAANAERQAQAGVALWDSYMQRFQGVSGGLRLESEVSPSYRELAAQLSESLATLTQAQRLFSLLELEPPESLDSRHAAARQEVARQRNALLSLRYVLGEDLAQQKLALLPTLDAES
ncbi:MAG: FHA domain-containing protein [Pseudomonadota bacterium]